MLQSAFRQAIRWKILAEDPCVGVDLPRMKRREMEALSVEECRRFLDAARGTEWHALCALALTTGMRPSEYLALKWSDVDFEERVLTIRAFNTKTMQERQVSLTTRLMIELERLWEESPKNTDFLVFGFTDNVKKSWTSARTKAGLPDVRFHVRSLSLTSVITR